MNRVVVLALAIALTMSTVLFQPQQASAANLDFACNPPRDTSITCVPSIYVANYGTLYVNVNAATYNTSCLFQARGYYSNTRYGPLTQITPGQTKALYTNTLGGVGRFKINVYCDPSFSVWVTGTAYA